MNRLFFAATFFVLPVIIMQPCSARQDTASTDGLVVSDTIRPEKPDTSTYGIVTVIQTPDKAGGSHTTTVKIGHKRHSRSVDISWLNFDLGLNNYVDRSAYGTAAVNDFAPIKTGASPVTDEQFSLRAGKSVNVNTWPVMATVNLINHQLNLKTGIGVEMNNYRYSRNITYVNDYSRTYVIRDSVNFKKNKLFTEYLTIPVLLNFESSPFHTSGSFRVSVGPTFGYLIKSRTKQVSHERHKEKNNSDFNLEKLRMGLRGELGFGPVTLYGSYSFTPIHQYGLKQYPFSIGLVLIGSHRW